MLDTTQFRRCIDTLSASRALLDQAEAGSVEYEVYRNATVKGFELTLEMGGSLLARRLKEFFPNPALVDTLPFKEVLRHATRRGLLSPEAVKRWFAYRDGRNRTVHTYGAALAEEAIAVMDAFVDDAKALAATLERLS